MNRSNQQKQLISALLDPSLKSGLYIIDTELSDEDIETFITEKSYVAFYKENLFPSMSCSPFDLFLIGLCHQCNNKVIDDHKNRLFDLSREQKESATYDLILDLMEILCSKKRTIIQIQGELDLISFSHEELSMLSASLFRQNGITIILCKQKTVSYESLDSKIKKISIKEINKYQLMENSISQVSISYKHDIKYEKAIEAITNGLDKNKIKFLIDKKDISYRDNIPNFEKKIGLSDRVIMFVTPKYLESLACMFEMTEIFNNGNILEKILPLVDLGDIKRDSDGLMCIRNFWNDKKNDILQKIKDSYSNNYLLNEFKIITEILNKLDNFWAYITVINTGTYEELIANDATLLMTELMKTNPTVSAPINKNIDLSDESQPSTTRTITQNGEKSIYIEHIKGNITIS